MHDDTVFCDEQQRNYVPTDISMTSYFDCRSIFMFDTKSRFAGKNHVCNSSEHITIIDKSEIGEEDPQTQNINNNMRLSRLSLLMHLSRRTTKRSSPQHLLNTIFSSEVEIVRLMCESIADLPDHERHARRVKTLRARVALCARQESRRRRPQSTQLS